MRVRVAAVKRGCDVREGRSRPSKLGLASLARVVLMGTLLGCNGWVVDIGSNGTDGGPNKIVDATAMEATKRDVSMSPGEDGEDSD